MNHATHFLSAESKQADCTKMCSEISQWTVALNVNKNMSMVKLLRRCSTSNNQNLTVNWSFSEHNPTLKMKWQRAGIRNGIASVVTKNGNTFNFKCVSIFLFSCQLFDYEMNIILCRCTIQYRNAQIDVTSKRPKHFANLSTYIGFALSTYKIHCFL